MRALLPRALPCSPTQRVLDKPSVEEHHRQGEGRQEGEEQVGKECNKYIINLNTDIYIKMLYKYINTNIQNIQIYE